MTRQAPLHTGFGETTTADEVMGTRRLDGKIAIVTGGYTGVGLETTRTLARAGVTVIVPARPESAAKARAAVSGIANVELDAITLDEPASIDAFAARFIASGRPLHYLFNNAGIMAVPFATNVTGFELQLATNHLGHFQLTARLWPALVQARGARVIVLSSRGHVRASVDLDDPNFARTPYDKWIAYGRSKTANALFALELDRRGESHMVRAMSVHPGAVRTELARSVPAEEVAGLVANVRAHFKNPAEGAATSIWAALQDGMGGVYCEDCDVADEVPAEAPTLRGVRPWARDPELARRLWTATEAWTGVTFA